MSGVCAPRRRTATCCSQGTGSPARLRVRPWIRDSRLAQAYSALRHRHAGEDDRNPQLGFLSPPYFSRIVFLLSSFPLGSRYVRTNTPPEKALRRKQPSPFKHLVICLNQQKGYEGRHDYHPRWLDRRVLAVILDHSRSHAVIRNQQRRLLLHQKKSEKEKRQRNSRWGIEKLSFFFKKFQRKKQKFSLSSLILFPLPPQGHRCASLCLSLT